jgi:hypothetical protein
MVPHWLKTGGIFDPPRRKATGHESGRRDLRVDSSEYPTTLTAEIAEIAETIFSAISALFVRF